MPRRVPLSQYYVGVNEVPWRSHKGVQQQWTSPAGPPKWYCGSCGVGHHNENMVKCRSCGVPRPGG
eukprot:14206674-Alexandrium_andersonii.AAC.1